jgi:hypothetical protein
MLRGAMLLAAFVCAGIVLEARGEEKTVCTITVNSADEKEALRARLPPDRYRFVELLEKGRPDWLKSSCARAVSCDVLVISGHFNAGDTFYSDRVAVGDSLSMDELERASCSDSCPALFGRLKEVYLFGCESLDTRGSGNAAAHGENGRARMQRIFANAGVIYGFSGPAPVGPTAGMLLHRHFDTAPGQFGTGLPSAALLRAFAQNQMTTARGARFSTPAARNREQACRFFDDRVAPATKLAQVHATMRRDMVEASAQLERIEALLASLTEAERGAPEFHLALATISADDATRARFLGAARATPGAARRLRMIALAETLGWLTPEGRRAERAAMVAQLLAAGSLGFAEAELVCALDEPLELGRELARLGIPAAKAGASGASAALACLGDAQARRRSLAALASPNDRDVQAAQVYLRHRPVVDAGELLALARDVGDMLGSSAQVRALDALARLHITDARVLDELMDLFAASRSMSVQSAVAEVFLRAGIEAIAHPGLAALLRRHRIGAPGRDDLVEALLRRLAAA